MPIAPTFTTVRVGEVIHVKSQALDQDAANVRDGSIDMDTSDAGVLDISNEVQNAAEGVVEADFTGIAPGSCNIQTQDGAGTVNTPAAVLTASSIIVVEGGLITVTGDAGDDFTVAVTARLVDVRHEAGAEDEPVYVGTDFEWTSDSVGRVQFDDGGGPMATSTSQSTSLFAASASLAELLTGATFGVTVTCKNSLGQDIEGHVNLKMRQRSTYSTVIVPPTV